MKPINLKRLLIAIAIPEAVGGLSALLSGNMGQMYQNYNKPPLSPPGIVFPIVWVLLYALMGIASYLVYEEGTNKGNAKHKALLFYAIQLGLNFLWSIVFFRFEAYTAAVVVIVLLDIFAIITALMFKKLYKPAFYLMIPYILWLLFATYLNIGVAVLN